MQTIDGLMANFYSLITSDTLTCTWIRLTERAAEPNYKHDYIHVPSVKSINLCFVKGKLNTCHYSSLFFLAY